jgi:hypothetical protein
LWGGDWLLLGEVSPVERVRCSNVCSPVLGDEDVARAGRHLREHPARFPKKTGA